MPNIIGPPVSAQCDAGVSKEIIYPYRYQYYLRVTMTAQMMLNNTATDELGAWATNATTGNNWYRSYNNISVGGLVRDSIYRSNDNLSVFSLFYRTVFAGVSGLVPPWCGESNMVVRSNFFNQLFQRLR
ncbi:MAG: hypothetical protein U0930_03630 [Pirellulales bacterium]